MDWNFGSHSTVSSRNQIESQHRGISRRQKTCYERERRRRVSRRRGSIWVNCRTSSSIAPILDLPLFSFLSAFSEVRAVTHISIHFGPYFIHFTRMPHILRIYSPHRPICPLHLRIHPPAFIYNYTPIRATRHSVIYHSPPHPDILSLRAACSVRR